MRFSIILVLCLLGCGAALSAQTATLTVLNGYGSGTYRQGDTIHIWAKEFAVDSVFAGWESPTSSMEVARWNEWHTTVIMRGSQAIIRAKFRYANPLPFSLTQFRIRGANRTVWYAFPAKPIGIITLHHFTNGTGNLWVTRTEYRQFCHAAFARGYALLAFSADEVERGDQNGNGLKQWQALPIDASQNMDHAITQMLIDSLIGYGVITRQTPRYAVGMSVGGGYTLGVAMSLGFNAWVNFCSGGSPAICDTTRIPGIFCPAENDANREDDIGGNTIKAFGNYRTLQKRGVRSEYLLNTLHPLYPERFARVDGINKATSIALYNELQSKGLLDSLHRPNMLPDSLEKGIRYTTLFPEFSRLKEDLWKEALYQYRVAYADHEFHADYTNAILDFFDSVRPVAPSTGAYCDSIVIDSVTIQTEQPFRGDLMIHFRNESQKWWAYPILQCMLAPNPYYTPDTKESILSLFNAKGDFANGRTHFNFHLTKTTPPADVPKDVTISGTAMLRLLNEQSFTYDTCTYAFSFKPYREGASAVDNDESNLRGGWNISPNPCNEHCVITGNGLIGRGRIILTDILGNQLENIDITEPVRQLTIATNHLPSGVYQLRMVTETGIESTLVSILR